MVYPATKSRKTDVVEHTPERPEHERYRNEFLRLPSDEVSSQVILRGVIDERLGRGWRLVSAIKEPGYDTVLLVWDTSGSSG
jgi:hypothetical protein